MYDEKISFNKYGNVISRYMLFDQKSFYIFILIIEFIDEKKIQINFLENFFRKNSGYNNLWYLISALRDTIHIERNRKGVASFQRLSAFSLYKPTK